MTGVWHLAGSHESPNEWVGKIGQKRVRHPGTDTAKPGYSASPSLPTLRKAVLQSGDPWEQHVRLDPQ